VKKENSGQLQILQSPEFLIGLPPLLMNDFVFIHLSNGNKFFAALEELKNNNLSDESLMKEWSLLAGGQVIFTKPRAACLRGDVLNHLVHHRAQLGGYLRLNDAPVPALYGPSADEDGM
jgi:uncharacterized damage-inducible protein DinB